MSAELDSALAGLKRRAQWAGIVIMLFIAASSLFAVLGIVVAVNGLVADSTLGLAYAFSAVAAVAFFLISTLLISMWIHRAHANLFTAGLDGLEYTPGWSVGWFFIPFANLVKPYHAMVELWNRSIGSGDHGLLQFWWGFFLVGGVIENVGSRMVDQPGAEHFGTGMMAIGSALRVVAALLLLTIIRRVTAAQDGLVGIGGTFD